MRTIHEELGISGDDWKTMQKVSKKSVWWDEERYKKDMAERSRSDHFPVLKYPKGFESPAERSERLTLEKKKKEGARKIADVLFATPIKDYQGPLTSLDSWLIDKISPLQKHYLNPKSDKPSDKYLPEFLDYLDAPIDISEADLQDRYNRRLRDNTFEQPKSRSINPDSSENTTYHKPDGTSTTYFWKGTKKSNRLATRIIARLILGIDGKKGVNQFFTNELNKRGIPIPTDKDGQPIDFYDTMLRIQGKNARSPDAEDAIQDTIMRMLSKTSRDTGEPKSFFDDYMDEMAKAGEEGREPKPFMSFFTTSVDSKGKNFGRDMYDNDALSDAVSGDEEFGGESGGKGFRHFDNVPSGDMGDFSEKWDIETQDEVNAIERDLAEGPYSQDTTKLQKGLQQGLSRQDITKGLKHNKHYDDTMTRMLDTAGHGLTNRGLGDTAKELERLLRNRKKSSREIIAYKLIQRIARLDWDEQKFSPLSSDNPQHPKFQSAVDEYTRLLQSGDPDFTDLDSMVSPRINPNMYNAIKHNLDTSTRKVLPDPAKKFMGSCKAV